MRLRGGPNPRHNLIGLRCQKTELWATRTKNRWGKRKPRELTATAWDSRPPRVCLLSTFQMLLKCVLRVSPGFPVVFIRKNTENLFIPPSQSGRTYPFTIKILPFGDIFLRRLFEKKSQMAFESAAITAALIQAYEGLWGGTSYNRSWFKSYII